MKTNWRVYKEESERCCIEREETGQMSQEVIPEKQWCSLKRAIYDFQSAAGWCSRKSDNRQRAGVATGSNANQVRLLRYAG